ncbi:DUF4143 domain-containing protein [Sinorhizobium fredii]|uniref:DUF4143 domain-containing protein n=1 Tax=Rhizobium fredii TaxID=380 RepID=UPI0035170773
MSPSRSPFPHPVAGASWEGFVIETLAAAAPYGSHLNFYRTAAGAEIDLLITPPGALALGQSRSNAASLRKWERDDLACEAIDPEKRLVVYPGSEICPLRDGVEAMPLSAAGKLLCDLASILETYTSTRGSECWRRGSLCKRPQSRDRSATKRKIYRRTIFAKTSLARRSELNSSQQIEILIAARRAKAVHLFGGGQEDLANSRPYPE